MNTNPINETPRPVVKEVKIEEEPVQPSTSSSYIENDDMDSDFDVPPFLRDRNDY